MGSIRTQIETLRDQRGAGVMGVLNCTPDSFYDGGKYLDTPRAIERVERLIAEGADVLDIGGESTRPGSQPIAADEQLRRIEPALRHSVAAGAIVSVDTTSPIVARRALELGAHVVNDVSCLADAELARATADHGAVLIVMHSRGSMAAMPGYSTWPENDYGDIVADVVEEWSRARDRAVGAGMQERDVWLDPGIGFAKSAAHSLELFARLDELCAHGAPVVIGPSRKSFIAEAHPSAPEDRLGGTVAACVLAAQRGASLVRVHDVLAVRQALAVTRAATRPRGAEHLHA